MSKFFEKNGLNVKVAVEDADSSIVRTTIDLATQSNESISVIGNNGYFLVSLITLTPIDTNIYFYIVLSREKKSFVWNTIQ